MCVIYGTLINQNKFKNHTWFSASFYKINEEDQIKKVIKLFINLYISHNLTDSETDIINNKSQLERQIQIQEAKESGSIFEKYKPMIIWIE